MLDPSALDGTINWQAYVGEPIESNGWTYYGRPGLFAGLQRAFGAGGYFSYPAKAAPNHLNKLQSARNFGLADAIGRGTPEARSC